MKNTRKILCTILCIIMSASLCCGMRADALTRLYYPDGTIRLVLANRAVTETAGGITLRPRTTVYAPDGRTLVVLKSEVELYKTVGWYAEPVRIMYAADGRTLVIKTEETDAYINVGWYTEPVRTMYAADGRTLVIKTEETTAYINVGWFTEPPIKVYAVDGRTLDIHPYELDAYLAVGWYKSPADFPKNVPMVALTFDDGPSKYTSRILDCLEANHAKATFFVVGNSVNAHASALKRAYDLGMEIGSHTMTHPNLKTLSAGAITNELQQVANRIISVTGAAPTLLRPPYGNYNSTVSSVAGLPLILWSVDTLDWKTRNADKTVNCVLNEVKDGSIVLMHDLYEPTAAAAERIIPALIRRGYRLVTVSELAAAKGYFLTDGTAYHSFK